ncbi:TraR/DksA C4-type zinc finger protein [Streptosporangium sp. NBC_01756]|uniref:TraR/DksA C4-type zinc finger protein n=1 Tax=Streptosporangium sp. NBC_01756 TaxID=2975950 RepID=UPI002DD9CA0C|nr:TraR/DksA C4-type zinc finger protein [Streptosporangium sp. NBC_01756]WSC88998.1 TraR/DksA C4-type zinc finger protein [Streptosporangium sp. NBC_01756]
MGDIRSTSRLLEEYQRHTAQLEELHALLHERLGAARAEWDSLAEGAHLPGPPAADEPVSPARARAERARTTVTEIEAAIERLNSGVYGTCRRCGALITLRRLRLVPHTRHCTVCQDERRR